MLSKIYLAFERECTTAMNFQFRFAWNAWSSPAFGPTHQRRSAGTTVSGSDDFLQLTQFLFSNSALEVHSFSAGMQEKTLFISFSKGVTGILSWEIAHVRRKTNVLVWSAILHVAELHVLVYSRVHLKFCQIRKGFCLLAYLRDICCTCIMSDNVLAVGLFWPPARTLSLT